MTNDEYYCFVQEIRHRGLAPVFTYFVVGPIPIHSEYRDITRVEEMVMSQQSFNLSIPSIQIRKYQLLVSNHGYPADIHASTPIHNDHNECPYMENT